MGVEYRRYLIPRPNTFRPASDATLSLVAALRRGGWILGEDSPGLAQMPFEQSSQYAPAKGRGYFACTTGRADSFEAPLPELAQTFADRDLMIVWPVESLGASGLRHPLDGDFPPDAYYELQLHFARDFIYHTSELIDPFEPAPTCVRGHPLEIDPESDEDPFYASRLAARCPACGAAFDPSRLVATGRNGWTHAAVKLQGGAAYRFALVVDCGKSFDEGRLHFHADLKSLVEKTLGQSTYEVEDFY